MFNCSDNCLDIVELEINSDAYNNSIDIWTILFNLTFNWTFPTEDYLNVSVSATNATSTVWHNVTNMFRVENDLFLFGFLNAHNSTGAPLETGDWVRAGEKVDWSDLIVVYEGTCGDPVYPPDPEFDVRVTDDDGDFWEDKTSSGTGINITSMADLTSDPSDNHTLEIVGIPEANRANNWTYELKVDGSQVLFSDFTPPFDEWQTTLTPVCNITVTDTGVKQVVGPSIGYRVSTNDGGTWGAWASAGVAESAWMLNASVTPTLVEGEGNRLQFRGNDSVGNGYDSLEAYPVLVDPTPPWFSDAGIYEPFSRGRHNVPLCITVGDNTSGLNLAYLGVSVRIEPGLWDQGISAEWVVDGGEVILLYNMTYPEANGRIDLRWYARDVAGNQGMVHSVYHLDFANVTFSDPEPAQDEWQTTSDVTCRITITEGNGSFVDGETIEYRLSTDNGTTWGDWQDASMPINIDPISPWVDLSFADGAEHLIQWRASDIAGNGPAESDWYGLMVDTTGVTFSDASPIGTAVSYEEQVAINITITDATSGVDTERVEMAVSFDGGSTWSSWQKVEGLAGGNVVDVGHLGILPNGTDNRVKFQAYDVAGNGPVESEPITVNVDLWTPVYLLTGLVSPADGATLNEDSITLEWGLLADIPGVVYDVYLDTVNPPLEMEEKGVTGTSLDVTGLDEDVDYFWTVIPRIPGLTGECDSGVWSFEYDKEAVLPQVTLVAPTDGATVTDGFELQWAPEGDGARWTYLVYIDTVYPPLNIAIPAHDETFYSPSGLPDNNVYYWRVLPNDDGVIGECLSGVWAFTYMEGGEPPEVELVSPADGAYIKTEGVTLTWASVGDGSGWTYSVYRGAVSRPNRLLDSHVNDTEYTLSGLEPGTYYWGIVPTNAEGISGYMEVWSFTVIRVGIEIGPIPDLVLDPGESKVVRFNFTNTGSITETFQVSVYFVEADTMDVAPRQFSIVSVEGTPVTLEPGESGEIVVTLKANDDATGYGDSPEVDVRPSDTTGPGGWYNRISGFRVTVSGDGGGGGGDGGGEGGGGKEGGGSTATYAIIAIVLAVVAVVALLLIMRMRKGKGTGAEEEEVGGEGQGAGAPGAPGSTAPGPGAPALEGSAPGTQTPGGPASGTTGGQGVEGELSAPSPLTLPPGAES